MTTFEDNVNCVLGFVAYRIEDETEGFPPTLAEAHNNVYGDGILSSCAIEIAEGTEDSERVLDPSEIAGRAIALMERVREDVDSIIAALRQFPSPEGE